MKKRFIFDLDGTLLTSDYHLERELFTDLYGEEARDFISKVGFYLDEYESLFSSYDVEILSCYLKGRTGLSITDDVIREWISITGDDPGVMEEGVLDTFECLKSMDCSIAVLTNWFLDSQKPRLRDSGLLEYVDEIYAGDTFLKPRKEAYLASKKHYRTRECVVIGDQLDKDYIGPRKYGFDSVLYDKNDRQHKNIVKVKKINEIMKRY